MNVDTAEKSIDKPVRVTANDYAYDGWLVAVFPKRSGYRRCVVEDSNGRLFIHNPSQIELRTGEHTRMACDAWLKHEVRKV